MPYWPIEIVFALTLIEPPEPPPAALPPLPPFGADGPASPSPPKLESVPLISTLPATIVITVPP